jgi:hypothetical protein
MTAADAPQAIQPTKLGAELALVLATALAAIAACGIALPSTYARETSAWAAQAVGQDWFNLVIAVPWMVLIARRAEHGSRGARLLLASTLLYAEYQLVIYSFGVRFNSLFLLYCGALGVTTLALIAVAVGVLRDPGTGWREGTPVKTIAAVLFGTGSLFAFLWLAEILPAIVHGQTPASIAATGLPTNPVHVMDLAFILPAHIAAAALILRRRGLAEVLATVLLGFDLLMSASIAGMLIVMRLRDVQASSGVIIGMMILAVTDGLLLGPALPATGSRPATVSRPP